MLSPERCPGPEEVQEQRECAGGGRVEQPEEGPELDMEMS